MKRLAAAFALAALAALPAAAADLSMKDGPAGITIEAPSGRSWTQVFVGLSGACETGTTETRVDHTHTVDDVSTTKNLVDFQGIGSSGCSAAPFIGADWQITGSRLVIGAEGEWRYHSDESKLSLYGGYGGEFEGSAKIESSWLLSGRLGALLDKDTLLYGRIGFGQADGSWSATFGQSEHHGDLPTFSTIAYGAGLEHRFADGQGAVRIEYRHVDFSKEEAFSFGPADCVTRGTIEPSFDMGLIGVSWRLGR